MAENGLKKSQEVGIERRLIENPLPQPIPGGNSLRPFIVGSAVAGEMIEKRDRSDFEQVERAAGERRSRK